MKEERLAEPHRILVGAERQNGHWQFAVRDNGPGIEADYLERIFLPFERRARYRDGRQPNLIGVVLDPPALRIDLG